MQKIKLELNSLELNSYGLIGDESSVDLLCQVLDSDFEIKKEGNPDFISNLYENFTIDDARHIKNLHETKPIGVNSKKIFILFFQNITVEAQNALLKLLEEPAGYAHFFIVVPQAGLLLPTVRSRLYFLEYDRDVESNEVELTDLVTKFIKQNKAKRLEMVKKICDDISKDKISKHYAILFVQRLEEILHNENKLVANAKKLENISIVNRYINDRAPSLKMLLEYLALSI